jgi:Tfp pilus assembly protein PilO
MKRNKAVAIAVVAVVGALVWYTALYSPARRERGQLGAQVAAAERREAELLSTRVRLRSLEAGRGAQQAQLKRLQGLIPAQPDVAGFILGANDAAVRSRVDWVSVAPAAAVAGAAGVPSAIGVSIGVNGEFFALVDYLRRLEGLGRLVVVDSLQLSPGAQAAGPLRLSATLSARIFTTAGTAPVAADPAGAAPAAAE